MDEYWVWVDVLEKIASFHEIEKSSAMHFEQHDLFMSYLFTLTTQGYRFQ